MRSVTIMPQTCKEETEVMESTQLLMDTIVCSKESAGYIIRNLESLQIGELISAEKKETEEDHSIVVMDTNGDEYELGIDKKDNLYSVKDMRNGDYLFTVYE